MCSFQPLTSETLAPQEEDELIFFINTRVDDTSLSYDVCCVILPAFLSLFIFVSLWLLITMYTPTDERDTSQSFDTKQKCITLAQV